MMLKKTVYCYHDRIDHHPLQKSTAVDGKLLFGTLRPAKALGTIGDRLAAAVPNNFPFSRGFWQVLAC
jgi:hypothetical protein